MGKIKIAIVGVGNCVSSLIQGIHYYRGKNREDAIGLMHYDISPAILKSLPLLMSTNARSAVMCMKLFLPSPTARRFFALNFPHPASPFAWAKF
jgi:hypothetical protein